MNPKLLKALPHVVAIIVFITLSSTFFSPSYQGYDLRQGDIAQFLGMSKEIRDYREFYDQETLWTNSMFSGMPSYQISLIQSRNIPKMIFTFVRDLFPGPVGTLLLAMISFYILGLCLKINPWISMLGAIAFGFSTINILYLGAGHASKVNAIALMPGVVGGVLLAFRRNALMGAAVAALWLAMHLAANHLQMTYYLLYLVGFVGISEIIRLVREGAMQNAIKASGLLVVGAILALLPNMTNILSTYSYSKYTTRGETELTIVPEGSTELEAKSEGLNKEYMLEYSLSRGEFWSMMIPDIKGGVSGAIGNDRDLLSSVDRNYREQVAQSNRYWGAQRFTGGAFYFGAFIMVLFILSFFVLKDRIKWPFLVLAIISILLSWKNASGITDFFIDYVPLFSKFRDTKMMLVLISIMAPILAMMTIQLFVDGIAPERKKVAYLGAGIAVLPLILFLGAPGAFFDMLSPAELQQFDQFVIENNGDFQASSMIEGLKESLAEVRMSIVRADAIRSLLIALVGLTLVFLIDRKILKPLIGIGAILVLITIDSYSVNKRYLNEDKIGKEYRHWQHKIDRAYPHGPSPADQQILQAEVQKNPELATDLKQAVEDKMANLDDGMLDNLKRQEKEMAKAKVQQSAQFGMLNLKTHYRVLNISNPFSDARTSYFHKSLGGYHGAKLKRYQELIEFHLGPELQRFLETANTLGPAVLRGMEISNMLNTEYLILDPNGQPLPNPNANGNAWFVGDIEVALSADEEMEMLYTLQTKQTAVVHEDFESLVPSAITPDSTATIALTDYQPNHLTYESSTSKEQLALFSEIWYPEGWICYLDGEETEFARANYLLRALTVPAGEHVIEFVFDPAEYHTGQTLSMIGSILLLLFVIGLGYLGFRKEPEATQTA